MGKNKYFVDTSALFKRYIMEAGTEKMDRLLEDAGSFIISSLSIVECVSNLKRLADVDKKIEQDVFHMVMANLFEDIQKGVLEVEPVTSGMMMEAVEVICGRYITPVDAVQLAMLKILRQKHKDVVFVCSDKKLCAMAEELGFQAVLP